MMIAQVSHCTVQENKENYEVSYRASFQHVCNIVSLTPLSFLTLNFSPKNIKQSTSSVLRKSVVRDLIQCNAMYAEML